MPSPSHPPRPSAPLYNISRHDVSSSANRPPPRQHSPNFYTTLRHEMTSSSAYRLHHCPRPRNESTLASRTMAQDDVSSSANRPHPYISHPSEPPPHPQLQKSSVARGEIPPPACHLPSPSPHLYEMSRHDISTSADRCRSFA